MKCIFFILSFVVLIFSCSPNNQSKDNTSDSTISPNKPIQDKLETKILGIWTDGTTDNAAFEIRKDSIFYVDQLLTFKYSIDKDSIQINYNDWVFKSKIFIQKDTLFLSSEFDTSKYWHFNK
jgi:hypothetical protein